MNLDVLIGYGNINWSCLPQFIFSLSRPIIATVWGSVSYGAVYYTLRNFCAAVLFLRTPTSQANVIDNINMPSVYINRLDTPLIISF